jgi:hypothetical protein
MHKLILMILAGILAATPSFATTYGQVFQSLLTQQRATGVVLSGGKVYFYSPGTTNLATVYTDRNMGTVAANPATLSADGTAAVFGNGQYDVKITTAAGVQKYYYYGVSLVDVSPLSPLSLAFSSYTSVGRLTSDSTATNSDKLDNLHSTDFATAAQGVKADAAQPAATAINTGNIAAQTVATAGDSDKLDGGHWVEVAVGTKIFTVTGAMSVALRPKSNEHRFYRYSCYASTTTVPIDYSYSPSAYATCTILRWGSSGTSANDQLIVDNISVATGITVAYKVDVWE